MLLLLTMEFEYGKNKKLNRYFHIFYNPSRQAAEREQFEQRIEKLRLFMDKHIGKDE